LGLLCEIWPFVSSSRTAFVEIIFDLVIIYIYQRNRGSLSRFFQIFAICIVIALGAVVTMGLLRNLSQRGEVREAPVAQTFADQILGSGDFLPAEREAYIIEHFRGYPFAYGSTYLVWLAEPIPQTIWPERPSAGDLGKFVAN